MDGPGPNSTDSPECTRCILISLIWNVYSMRVGKTWFDIGTDVMITRKRANKQSGKEKLIENENHWKFMEIHASEALSRWWWFRGWYPQNCGSEQINIYKVVCWLVVMANASKLFKVHDLVIYIYTCLGSVLWLSLLTKKISEMNCFLGWTTILEVRTTIASSSTSMTMSPHNKKGVFSMVWSPWKSYYFGGKTNRNMILT